ncbi:hypothetical protein AB833_05355 [Chromatiales bacterium (ex Bugula neritina AB1)]|nr:hypothetical protein AB833_05355 [Chromatiales bacterium (ex Bugula neritina AB1)]
MAFNSLSPALASNQPTGKLPQQTPCSRAPKALALAASAAITLTSGVAQATASTNTESIPSLERRTIITENGVATTLSYPPLEATNTRNSNSAKASQPKARQITAHNDNYWVREATLNLNQDNDHDGHYSSFNVTLDVDTHFSLSTVYAVLYLSHNGGVWNEYAVTGNFSIYAGSHDDSYSIDAVLDSGYPSGYYDHHIEIYDADTLTLLSHYGPEHSHYFHDLPFESRHHDEWSIDTSLSLNFSGSGSMGYPTVLLVSLLLIRRRWLKSNSSAET